MTTRSAYRLFVGLDVAAASFTAAWCNCTMESVKPGTFPQTAAGFAAPREHLAATGIPPATTLVVLDATGRYWVTLAVTLHQAGYAVSVRPSEPYRQLREIAATPCEDRSA